MKLQRQVGQTSQILLLYVQDSTVSTGAGLANVVGSTVSYTWFHNNQVSVSSGTASTAGTTGTYSTSAWTMISSSLALGWYQFGAPDGVFATGDSVGIHFYVSSGPNTGMAPLPVEIELVRDNPLQFSSSKVFLAHTSTSPANITQALAQPIVTSGAGILNVSTQAIDKGGYGVTTVSAAITTNANVIQAYGSAIVTSASGQFLVSTQSLVGITTAANVIQVYGSAVVTSASGQFRVSTQAIDKGGYGVTTNADKSGYDVTSFYGTAAVTSGGGILNVSTQTLPSAGAGDISTIYGQPIVTSAAGILDVNLINILNSAAVTSAAGQLRVSTQSLANITTFANVIAIYSSAAVTSASGQFRVSTQAIDKGGYGVTTNADKLNYDITSTYGTALVTSGAGILNVSTQTVPAGGSGDIISVYGVPIVTSGAGILRVSTQSLVGIVVSTQAIDKGGYGVTTNADKTGYTLTAADQATLAGVILTTTQAEGYRASSDVGSITQLMYEVLANVTDMTNTGTTRALNSVTSHTANGLQYQYDSTTPSAISRIA